MYPSNKKKKVWREEKERLLKMTLEERRKEYIRDYVPLSTILSWKEEMKNKGQNNGCIPKVGEMENVMGERTCRSLPETSYGKKVLQSILNQGRLIEDSFENSLL
ncbi:ADP-ribose glycohydrolase MACROD2-like [Onychomys torridus]|uniref:ADP-ribose glycohydrolase MACROD2-like n=1 Tax=Onychomys torridus TaxID=38674 RepID=UPI00167F7ED0|nr:ADP-ribose glycohydrolase MACROD2-like [Onychomys torridus]